jgi:hypothetical protein
MESIMCMCDKWKTIESAPRDGTRILAWYQAKFLAQEIVAAWSDEQEAWVDWACEPIEAEVRDGQCVLTKWQPLPQPPTDGE